MVVLRSAARFSQVCRALHTTPKLHALSPLRMPAMSPTMESGTIARWNVTPGTRFSAGDVIVAIETDKAEVDVEAQEDGVMGMQTAEAGKQSIKVGEVIAVLGESEEEVKDAKPLEEWSGESPPKKEAASEGSQSQSTSSTTSESSQNSAAPSDSAHHGPIKSRLPLAPAVSRLLQLSGHFDSTSIKGTGLHGRLTKGDVLAFLGKTKSPHGTAAAMVAAYAHPADVGKEGAGGAGQAPMKPAPPLDGPSLRRLIAAGLAHSTSAPPLSVQSTVSFESVLAGYSSQRVIRTSTPLAAAALKNDAWAALLSR